MTNHHAVISTSDGAASPPTWRTALLALAMACVLFAFPLWASRTGWLTLSALQIGLCYASAPRDPIGQARCLPVLHLGVLATLLLLLLAAFGTMKYWPLPPAFACLGYGLLLRCVPAFGGRPSWLVRGRIHGGVVGLMIASVALSSLALVLWFAVAKPDYSELIGSLFPHVPLALLILGIVGFSGVNAAIEEFIYRGVVLAALDGALGARWWTVLLQAALFGILHIAGIPRGLVGVALATIYGLMMGLVRRRAGGMLAPYLAHIGTDIAIGSILLTLSSSGSAH